MLWTLIYYGRVLRVAVNTAMNMHYINKHAHIYTLICVYTHKSTNTYAFTHTYTHIHAHILTFIHAPTHIHMVSYVMVCYGMVLVWYGMV